MIHIVTDSSADLPKALLEKYHITTVPLTIELDGEEYLEGIDISSQEFFKRMFLSEDLPKTSQPSPLAFANAFNQLAKEEEVLCLTISSGLSGTYQSALLGKDMCQGTVEVFDTLGGSLAHGILVLRAAKLAQAGWTMEKIIGELRRYQEGMEIFILLDTLENIVKGGRLNKFSGSLAKLLNIKVILEGKKGKVEILERIRGKKKTLNRMLNLIQERKKDYSNITFGITHVDNLEDVEYIKNEILRRFQPKDIIINDMGATMGTYAGKGGMIISFL